MEGRVEELVQEGAEMKKRMDSMDAKMDTVDQDVVTVASLTQGWRYLGHGFYLRHDEESYQGTAHTLAQCCQICEGKHSADRQWNGFLWYPQGGYCYCEKNDQGHDPTRGHPYMHFLKQ